MTADAIVATSVVVIIAISGGLLAFYSPRSRWARVLRTIFIAAGSLVLVSLYLLTHSALATMKKGDFWVFEPTLFNRPVAGILQLPHPYDYYLYQSTRWAFFILLPIVVAITVVYFLENRRVRQKQA